MEPSDRPRRSVLDAPTLVLNRSWVPIHVTIVRRAVGMICRGIASVVDPGSLSLQDFDAWASLRGEPGRHSIRTATRWLPVPEIVQLAQYDRVPSFEAPFTRASLFRRDDHRCQYCGTRPPHSQLTIDHVLPRSRGGRTSWDNCVVACVRCNARKGDRLPGTAGLRLMRTPRAPRWTPHLHVRAADWPGSWNQFLGNRHGQSFATGT
jgi:5-methylcytosine-specific restriction endonuclease McrA